MFEEIKQKYTKRRQKVKEKCHRDRENLKKIEEMDEDELWDRYITEHLKMERQLKKEMKKAKKIKK